MDLYGIPSIAQKQLSVDNVEDIGPIEIHDVKADEFTAFLKLLIKP